MVLNCLLKVPPLSKPEPCRGKALSSPTDVLCNLRKAQPDENVLILDNVYSDSFFRRAHQSSHSWFSAPYSMQGDIPGDFFQYWPISTIFEQFWAIWGAFGASQDFFH